MQMKFVPNFSFAVKQISFDINKYYFEIHKYMTMQTTFLF